MCADSVSGKELVLKVLAGGKGHRTPVFSADQSATYELMEKVSAYWPEANVDARGMATLAGAAHTVLGFDAVRIPFDQTIEAEALGSKIKDGGRENLPSIAHHRYTIGEKPEFPEDFMKRGRIPALIEAIKILKDIVGDKAAVIGGIIGPFSIAGNIVDITELLAACMLDPGSVTPYIEIGEKAGTMLGRALIAAGADAICIEDMMASLDLISPPIYRNMVWSWEKKQLQQLQDIPTILHVCGQVDTVITDLAGTGATALSLDTKVDVRAVKTTLMRAGKKLPLIGGIDCINTLLPKGPEDIEDEVLDAIDDGYDMIAPSCSIPPATSTENLLAMMRGVQKAV